MSDPRPTIALTLGDVAGVGPEVVIRAWSNPTLHDWCRPLVIGRSEVLKRACRLLGSSLNVRRVESPETAEPTTTEVPCIDVGDDALETIKPGLIDARAGRAAFGFLTTAIDLAKSSRIDAIVTLPLNKEGLRVAGVNFAGHTEILAQRCGVEHYAMMLYVTPPAARGAGGLGVVHVTLHVALRDVFEGVTIASVEQAIRLANDAMRPFLTASRTRIGVSALNPHAGEHGLFGDEETTIIGPAVERARLQGLCVDGPIAADALFRRGFEGEFDAIVAMYHDQGHVAVKSVAFWEAVNVTLGLPIIRTSVAHGTAYDIAWHGKARSTSLLHAVRVASKMAIARVGRPGPLRTTSGAPLERPAKG
jgi:4-hydroxythreonine-4-phosphate dehydrogenase